MWKCAENIKNIVSILEANLVYIAQDDVKLTVLCLKLAAAGITAMSLHLDCFTKASPGVRPCKAHRPHTSPRADWGDWRQ